MAIRRVPWRQTCMADLSKELRSTLEGIKKAAESDLTISRSAVAEIERLVKLVNALSGDVRLVQEGERLLARALGRFAGPVAEAPSPIVTAARFHGAIARYEFVLRQAGLLGEDNAAPPS
jgi:hypothetical protein